jgi:hypothetical protein
LITYKTTPLKVQFSCKRIKRKGEMPDEVVDMLGKDTFTKAASAEEKVGLLGRFYRAKNYVRKTAGQDVEGERVQSPVPFLKLFCFTTRTEKFMLVCGAVCAFLHGAMLPMFAIVFGSVVETFSKHNSNMSQLAKEIGSVAKVCPSTLMRLLLSGPTEATNSVAPAFHF